MPTESIDDSLFPSLAVDSAGNVHIAWADTTDYAGAGTDYDIFYKRLTSSPVISELANKLPPLHGFILFQV